MLMWTHMGILLEKQTDGNTLTVNVKAEQIHHITPTKGSRTVKSVSTSNGTHVRNSENLVLLD
jgi:hypothetical protein